MRAPAIRRHPLTSLVAAFLLLLEAAGGALGGLLHAAEAMSAPAGIEAEHGASCRVVHDPARCATCRALAPAMVPEPSRELAFATVMPCLSQRSVTAPPPRRTLSRSAPPRAPPPRPV
jgi:hypothetical protein